MHGGKIPNAREKADERVTLAQLLASGERRHPGLVLLDATHFLDVLMRDARARLGEGGEVTPDELDRFVQAVGRAAHLAKTTLDAGVAQQLAYQLRRSNELEGAIISAVLGRTLDALAQALGLSPEWRDWATWVARAELLALGDGSRIERGRLVGGGQPAELPPPPSRGDASSVLSGDPGPAGFRDVPNHPIGSEDPRERIGLAPGAVVVSDDEEEPDLESDPPTPAGATRTELDGAEPPAPATDPPTSGVEHPEDEGGADPPHSPVVVRLGAMRRGRQGW